MEQETIKCSGTGCQSNAIGTWLELREVPAWRHPVDRVGERVFDVVKEVRYCAEHERAAKSST